MASTALAQPEMVPPSVAKMKLAFVPGAGPTVKLVVLLATMPVHTVLAPAADGGMIALVALTENAVAL